MPVSAPAMSKDDAAEATAPDAETAPSAQSTDDAGHDLEQKLEGLEDEARDLRDRLARARADYENLQKRQARDAALERERVKARFLEGFLQVYEYANMAGAEAERTPGPLSQGVLMVVQQFRTLLQDEGVLESGTIGEPFDAARHEAVGEEAVDGVAPGCVARVVRSGYLLGDRVLRYAQVVVAPQEAEE